MTAGPERPPGRGPTPLAPRLRAVISGLPPLDREREPSDSWPFWLVGRRPKEGGDQCAP